MTDHGEKTDKILDRLRAEFVDTARDQLEEVERRLDWLDYGRSIGDGDLYDIQRNIHNIKGQGTTFGYPLVGRVAHMFEDYLANAGGVRTEIIGDLRAYIDVMNALLTNGENIPPEEGEALLRSLPLGRPKGFSQQKDLNVNVLLVMPSGVQRRLVAQELLSCGFTVNRAYDSVEAISVALDLSPDIVFINNDMAPFSGRELAKVFAAVDRLSDVHIVLLTGYEADSEHLGDLPDNLSIVVKRRDFTESIGQLLMEWGVFGNISSKASR